MSLTLGEKLRQAREERGISISEVAEQTRISSLYLESIENDNYKPLPGGIFNKGFVKSYAKFIGFDEQEALSDYGRIAAANEIAAEQPLKVYRPEVLTDDTSSSSMVPTILFAGVILALMTGGILFVLNYIQNQPATPTNTANANTNVNLVNANLSNTETTPVDGAPTMAHLKVEFRAFAESVSLTSISDGRSASATVATGTAVTFEPKESLRLSYSKSLAQSARLSMNGKPIILPEAPQNPRRNVIEFEINKDNVAKIWQEGRIASAGPDANANVTANGVNATVSPTRPPATPVVRPSVTPGAVNRPPAGNTGGTATRSPQRPTPN